MSSTPLNLGIVAHVDAGKTSLTERLLFEAGAIAELGSVDSGTTSTDSLALERRRGITIRAAVTSFALPGSDGAGAIGVNVVDTPGHPDFIAEVERSLGVLDAAVLVLSAVEGVQPQSVLIWRALRRIGVPTLIFVNKVDRSGADVARVVDQVRRRLAPHVVVLTAVEGAGTAEAVVRRLPLCSPAVVEAVAEVDDDVLDRWAGGGLEEGQVLTALRAGVGDGSLAPVLAGSAITGAGLEPLRRALAQLLPHPGPTGAGELGATVFAVDRDDRGRRTWLRLWSGELRLRDRIGVAGGRPERVTGIEVSTPDGQVAGVAGAGDISVVRGLGRARIGDVIGVPPARTTPRFPPATLQALVEPVDPTQRGALFAGLAELADEDPLIGLRIDETDREAAVSLHGDVQKEVIAALLEDRFGVRARFLATSTVCIERVLGTGEAVERVGVADNPYLASIGLRVEPAPDGHGIGWTAGIEPGRLPPAFIAATEEGVRRTLRQGLHGWQVTDCRVTMTASWYAPRQSRPHQGFNKAISSVGADFRHLAAVVVMAALARAGTVVCRPIEEITLDLPTDSLGVLTDVVGRLGATILDTVPDGGYTRLVAHLPSAQVPELARRLPDLTGGEGVLVGELSHHAPVPPGDVVPEHARSHPDAMDRVEWFRDVPR
ncbi:MULTISPECIES: GTP-binding protein [unclassified Nocardioides]|uniref:GTP-binding protein n=1 Tax=unclassified Nocardioides TaxID=2615069 RepID=UPI0036107891